ncbi:hypothetical protein GCM10027290_09640 [Micromonospora sonneratiae]
MKAHRTDGVSLTFGLLFLGIVAWWLVAQFVDLALPAVGWFVAGALLLFGVMGLFGALRSARAAAQPTAAPPTSAPTSDAGIGSTSDAGNRPTSDAGIGSTSDAGIGPVGSGPTEPVTAPPVTDADDRWGNGTGDRG